MKILVLQSELGVLRGGGENFTRNLFTAFANRGHHIVAAFVANRRGEYPIALPTGMHPIPLNGWWSMNLGQATLGTMGRFIRTDSSRRKHWDRIQEAVAWRTIRWHNGRFRRRVELEFVHRWCHFDAVYVHGNTTLASLVARHRPTILRLPGPVTAELKPMLEQVPAVCANGDALLRIRRFLGDHATELPIGIDTQLFTPGRTSIRTVLGWTDQDRVIGYVGRLVHLKGVDLLAAAFRDVSRVAPNTRLLIIGSGPEGRYIRSVLAQEISSGIVHIEPDVSHDRLPEWYRAMDLIVMPSRYENLSNAVIEAMACGIPLLGSDIGGNKILADAGAGWLFERESVSSLTVSLSNIVNNDSDLKARGRVGLRYVRGRYDWAASAERLEWIISSRLGVER